MKMLKNVRNLKINANKSFYVTTPIYYVNAAPHIGHLYSSVIADAICRFQKLIGKHNSVRLCTGTDEHGSKIQQAAQKHGVPIPQYCDNISARYQSVFEQSHVGFSDFIRTTELRHTNAVQHFWNSLSNRDQIYLSQYSGWYCVSDETFLTDSQLRQDETSGTRFSIESGHPVEWTEETNYMFRLSKLQDDLIYWIKQGKRIRPAKFEKILLDMLNEPLCDVSVSRPTNRVHWGIPVPNNESQTVYVWLDALINYLTSAGYPDEKYRNFWPPNVQVIGKDILKFHGIYWPAFLIAAGLEPPEQLFVHSHWTVDGQKMSKSKQNVVDPVEAAKIYSMEGLRYFLLREGVAHSDGNYSNVKALRILNSELADTLGNLLSRACAKSLNPRQIYPGLDVMQLEDILQLEATKRLQEAIMRLQVECEHHYNDNNFYLVVDNIMATLHAANNFFESLRPWELKSVTDSNGNTGSTMATTTSVMSQRASVNIANATRLETIIAMTMDTLRICGIALQPIVPELSGRLLDKLNVPEEQRLWRNLSENFTNCNKCATTPRALNSIDAVLFRRILLKSEAPCEHHDKQPRKQTMLAKEKRAKKSKSQQTVS